MQIPIGSTFKDPGYFATSTAPGKTSPISITATVAGEDTVRATDHLNASTRDLSLSCITDGQAPSCREPDT